MNGEWEWNGNGEWEIPREVRRLRGSATARDLCAANSKIRFVFNRLLNCSEKVDNIIRQIDVINKRVDVWWSPQGLFAPQATTVEAVSEAADKRTLQRALSHLEIIVLHPVVLQLHGLGIVVTHRSIQYLLSERTYRNVCLCEQTAR